MVEVGAQAARGVLPSSSGEVYGLFVTAAGEYACGHRGWNGIQECPGQGWGGGTHPCQHLLAFVLGLAQQALLHPSTAAAWLGACRKRKPVPEAEASPRVEEALARHGPGQAGDWRAVETSPDGW